MEWGSAAGPSTSQDSLQSGTKGERMSGPACWVRGGGRSEKRQDGGRGRENREEGGGGGGKGGGGTGSSSTDYMQTFAPEAT